MKILVLGAGGFIGSHLVSGMLANTSHRIWAYDQFDDKLKECIGHPRLSFLQGDIRSDDDRLESLVRDCDVVLDLIAHANPSLYVTMPLDVVRLNFHENLKIAEMCVKHRRRLIQFSTCEVYGKTVVPLVGEKLEDADNPEYGVFGEDDSHMILGPVEKHRWIYSCAKQLLERILHAYGLEGALDYTIVRPFNFIGPRIDFLPSEHEGNPRVFSHFVQSLLDGSPMLLVNGGSQQRCYTYIDDAIDCILRIVENENGVCSKQIFNIGSPDNELTIRELAEKMREIFKRRWWDGSTNLPMMEDISGDEFYGSGYDDCDRRIPDIRKAQGRLGWQPQYGVDEVVEKSMEPWFTATGSLGASGLAGNTSIAASPDQSHIVRG